MNRYIDIHIAIVTSFQKIECEFPQNAPAAEYVRVRTLRTGDQRSVVSLG